VFTTTIASAGNRSTQSTLITEIFPRQPGSAAPAFLSFDAGPDVGIMSFSNIADFRPFFPPTNTCKYLATRLFNETT
jgi:hypothetical protein